MADAVIFVKVGQSLSVVGVPADAPVPPIVVAPPVAGWPIVPGWGGSLPGGGGFPGQGGPVDPGYSPPWATPGPKRPELEPDPPRASDRQSMASVCGCQPAAAAAAN